MTTIQRSVATVAPETQPLTVTEAKRHLEIAQSDGSHDAELRNLIIACREKWEHDTQSLTVSRTIIEKLADWPDSSWRFYYRPVTSIFSITYFDTANASQTLATTVYDLDAPNRRLLEKVDQEWPSIESRWDAITIKYIAGYASVPEIAKSAMKFQLDVLFELRGMTTDKDASQRAYNNLVLQYQRASYP